MPFASTDTYYLGLDLSTQQLKCLAINQALQIVHSETVEFDKELPHYESRKGVYVNGDVIDCPVLMWIEAIDLVFKKYVKAQFPLSQVHAISGSCQQHGSVYWSEEGEALLEKLQDKSSGSLIDHLDSSAFSRQTAPNWQDHSTGAQCKELESIVGGPGKLAELTGSRAHFRFTGPQILKVVETEGATYKKTARIMLVSNFLASVFCGKFVGLEEADSCGMNLYDIPSRKLNDKLLQFIDSKSDGQDGLLQKLGGEPMECKTPTPVGKIARYFADVYKLNPECSIFPMTGDNLATICSLPLQSNDVLISLGTSTTVLLVTDQYHTSPNYHMFTHPTIPDHYMGMICYCNGSLAREKVRDQLENDKSWTKFNDAVMDDSLDTSDELGIYFPFGEIVPSVSATYKKVKFDKSTGQITSTVSNFDNARHDAKNIVESQALSCRARISPLLNAVSDPSPKDKNLTVTFDYDTNVPLSEYTCKRPKRVFFVGGASKNDAIVKKFAQVLGATEGNYRLDTPNSCALGGCFIAMWSDAFVSKRTNLPFDQFLNKNFPWDSLDFVCQSQTAQWENYNKMLVPLSRLEAMLD
ncbi:xylulokinase KNAG_0G00850 [Huiozyma naganishii CBS 8797]|uniref:Xylulose kinase n=1 Tax=Huiozyma naganishii (strain ATCC MYA-139 / BCRC 22969 / CBS 8797 / KCTC 17520 / NBRC 10181 / NCYC 3082 / Yp74L-3) TaxID=1071383 RepID=J7S8W3_HUIN7|nr:hypothetical protein KNAG_0G00850 [Kazachstania naganishii CBS 8797]CCK71141.1 hypothetical protein KNAG_0G00850 [Kazachstania naganishii CBS 8797]